MIRFSCRCGHVFEEPDEAAGNGVQCPRCKLLNDVPRLSDLHLINEDGTYVLDEVSAPPKPTAVEDLLYVFAKTNVDDEGEAIDLRNQPEEMQEIGEFDTIARDQKRQRPRYDPETGEMIKPIPVVGNSRIQPAPIPFAKPAVVYATANTVSPHTAGHVLLELVQPINLFVMAFIVAVLLVGAVFGFLTIRGLYLLAPFVFGVAFVVMAHFGNVVDEIGIEVHDELPRVLRDFRWHEDFWWPAAAITATLLFCYGPAAAVIYFSPFSFASAIAWGSLLAMIGTYFLTAVALTLLTSGSISNLRPDRVLGVIQLSGKRYFIAVATFMIAVATSSWGVCSLIVEGLRMCLIPVPFPTWSTKLPLALSLLIIGTFVMHAFCWQLGLLYRANNALFPWVGRFHEREPRPPVLRRKPRYVGPRPVDQ